MHRTSILQGADWHHGGMFMGVHWAWWLFVLLAIVVVFWAFGRLAADRTAARSDAARMRDAEVDLRARFQRGEISEEQLARELSALLGIGPAPGGR